MEKFIDTHAHYNCRQFRKNEEAIINKIKESTKYAITLGTSAETNTETLRLISLYENLYGMIGFFPCDVWQLEDTFARMDADNNWLVFTKQLINQKIVGIGEIGLDYHHNCLTNYKKTIFCKGEQAQEFQKKWFIAQLNLAREKNLPVSIHSRDAEKDTLKIFEEYDSIKGVCHCFSYGIDSLEAYLEKGLYIGVGGTITYPRNEDTREAIKRCPIERILLETDAPYLTPNPVRKEVNDSTKIKYVVKELSKLKDISEDDIIRITNENANRLFFNKD